MGPFSQPTLHHYLVWLGMRLGGESIAGARLASALAGGLGILVTYWAALELTGRRRTALFAAALMTTYHYHIHWSRLALNNIWDTVWVPLGLAAFAWGWRTRWSGGAVLAGLALGFSQYFYHGSKVLLFLLAVLIYMLWRRDRGDSRLAIHVAKLGLTAMAVAAPIALNALLEPEYYFYRAREAYGWRPAEIAAAVGSPDAHWAYLWHQISHSFGAFNVYPDVTGFYGPGVPLLIGLASPLFVIGLLWAAYKRQGILLLWIVLTVLFGSIVLAGAPSSSHTVVAIPVICMLIALPLDWLADRGRAWLAPLALAAIMAYDLYFYFQVYVPSHPRDLIHDFPGVKH